MQLLVSVNGPAEAEAALAGGADVIDAKDPRAGALGAVDVDVLRQICCVVARARPVSAALGDADDEGHVEDAARRYAEAGAAFVKLGFAGTTNLERVRRLIDAAIRGAGGGAAVVPVAYADHELAGSAAPDDILDAAARAGATGVLMDTADKRLGGLPALISRESLVRWVGTAHHAGLFVALAGKLTADDLAFVRDAGADIAGVRGAACDGGRLGVVAAERVRRLARAFF